MDSTGLLPVLTNTIATVALRGTFGLARIAMLLLIARHFGPAAFGQLALVLAMVDVLKVAADLGVDTIMIRRLAAEPERAAALVDSVLALRLLLSTIGFLASPVAFSLMYPQLPALDLVLVVAVSVYTSLLTSTFVGYFQAQLAVPTIVTSNVLGVGVYVSATLLGLYLDLPLPVIVAAMPLGEVASLLLTSRLYRKRMRLRLEFDRAIIRGVLRESVYVGVAGVIVVAYLRLDHLMLGWFLGDRTVGQYAVGYRLIEPFSLVFSSLSTSLYASLSRARVTAAPGEVQRTVQRAVGSTAVVALASAVLLYVFGGRLLRLIFPEYAGSIGVLAVLSWSVVFRAVNMQLTAVINSRGGFRAIMAITVANLLLSIGCQALFIPRYGLVGAAMAVVVVEAINMLLQLTCVVRHERRHRKVVAEHGRA